MGRHLRFYFYLDASDTAVEPPTVSELVALLPQAVAIAMIITTAAANANTFFILFSFLYRDLRGWVYPISLYLKSFSDFLHIIPEKRRQVNRIKLVLTALRLFS